MLNEQRFEVLEEIVDPNVGLDPAAYSEMTGIPQVQQMLGELLGAFPDAAYTIEDTLVDGDRVVMRWTANGTHGGDYAGIASTGNPMRWSGIHFFHFACGRITGVWAEADLLAQLGLVDDVQATPTAPADGNGTPGAGCDASSPEEMEGFAHAWQDVWTSHDVTDYDGVVSPDAVHHFGVRSMPSGCRRSRAGWRGSLPRFPI